MKEYDNLTIPTAGQAFMDLADDRFKACRASPIGYANLLFVTIGDDSIFQNRATSVILGNQNLVRIISLYPYSPRHKCTTVRSCYKRIYDISIPPPVPPYI